MKLEEIHITDECEEFLTYLYENGESGTHEITSNTSLNNNQVHRRFNKFEESGHIRTETRNPAGKHWTQERFVQLTDKAHTELQTGVLGNIFTTDEPDDGLEEQVEDLEEQVEYLTEFVREAEIRLKGALWAIDESDAEIDVEHYTEKVREDSS